MSMSPIYYVVKSRTCGIHVLFHLWDLRIVSSQQEVEEEADGLLYVDLMGGWQTFVQLVEDSGQYCFQPSHSELSVEVHVVEAVLSEGLYDIPDVY